MIVWGEFIQHLGYERTQHICSFTVLETKWRSQFLLSIILQREKKSDATLLENPDLNWHLCFEIWQLVSSRFKLVIIWQTSHYGLKASFLLFMKHLRPNFYFKFSTDHKHKKWIRAVILIKYCQWFLVKNLKWNADSNPLSSHQTSGTGAFKINTFCSPRLHLLYLIKNAVKQ